MITAWEKLPQEKKESIREQARSMKVERILEPLKQKEKPSSIDMPVDWSEQSGVNGFIASHKFHEYIKKDADTVFRSLADGAKPFPYARELAQFTSDSAGAPMISTNTISVWIESSPSSAGSNNPYLYLHMGTKLILLIGYFIPGISNTWDLNNHSISTDDWDNISIEYKSSDALKIKRVKVVHSGITLVDWYCHTWLSTDFSEGNRMLGLDAKILQKKLSYVGGSTVNQIHWAAREIGKTDGTKYGTNSAWCSEFASWCLRKNSWNSPQGSIDTAHMAGFFTAMGRYCNNNTVRLGGYVIKPGDYIRIRKDDGGFHSALFLKWPTAPTAFPLPNNYQFNTIEGNSNGRVQSRTWEIKNAYGVGIA